MDIAIEGPAAELVERLVRSGRYASGRAVVEDALRLMEQEEAKRRDLQAVIAASLAEPGEYTDDEVGAYLDEVANNAIVRA